MGRSRSRSRSPNRDRKRSRKDDDSRKRDRSRSKERDRSGREDRDRRDRDRKRSRSRDRSGREERRDRDKSVHGEDPSMATRDGHADTADQKVDVKKEEMEEEKMAVPADNNKEPPKSDADVAVAVAESKHARQEVGLLGESAVSQHTCQLHHPFAVMEVCWLWGRGHAQAQKSQRTLHQVLFMAAIDMLQLGTHGAP